MQHFLNLVVLHVKHIADVLGEVLTGSYCFPWLKSVPLLAVILQTTEVQRSQRLGIDREDSGHRSNYDQLEIV